MNFNRKSVNKFFSVVFSLIFPFAVSVSGQSKYINKHRDLSDSLSNSYGIPTAVILGVAIIESGAGNDRNSTMLNNHFGIIGKNNLLQTKGIKTMYKGYSTAKASFVDFCQVISQKSFYSRLKGNMDYKAWLSAISKAGYSTKPDAWKKLITDAIVKLNLD